VEKFNALISTYADEVVLEFKEQEHVKINYVFRLQPEGGSVAIESPMRLGPILRDAPLHVLFEFIVDSSTLEEDIVLLLNGSLKISIAARPVPVPPIRLNLKRDVHTNPSPEPPPSRILSALSRLTLYRMQERARTAADAGQFDGASSAKSRDHLLKRKHLAKLPCLTNNLEKCMPGARAEIKMLNIARARF
jgi:Ca-activated chloride channel family protein